MRIRRCASRLLGVAVPAPAPPRFELPPPSPRRFELPPPPARESHAGAVAPKTSSSSSPEPCPTCFVTWDFMSQLRLSDPQEEERFVEEYSVPLPRRASWIFPATMPAGSIKDDEEEEDIVMDSVNSELHLAEKNNKAAIKTATKKDEIKAKTKKGKEKAVEGDDAGGAGVWKLPDISKPRRKRVSAFGDTVDDRFYYYAGFGPSRSKRQHRGSSSRSVPEPPPAEEKEVTPAEAQTDATDGADRIAGSVVEISSDDEDALRRNGEPARNVKMRIRISPVRKIRWRKRPLKSRSINSLL